MAVLVVTGVAREAKIAAGPGVETICSGGSPARLRSLLARYDPSAITTVMSFGIAGGLNPALISGHVVVADAVLSDAGRWAADIAITNAIVRALPGTVGLKVLRATILGVDLALLDPAAKAHARAQTGAAVVDMESHIAAEYAAGRGLPFAAVRVVCDPASHSLPPLVNEALKPDGSVSLKGVFASLRREPGQIGDLARLARDSRIAFRALAKAGAVLQAAFAKA
jgi:adenosylhomocysteine nucleosidase